MGGGPTGRSIPRQVNPGVEDDRSLPRGPYPGLRSNGAPETEGPPPGQTQLRNTGPLGAAHRAPPEPQLPQYGSTPATGPGIFGRSGSRVQAGLAGLCEGPDGAKWLHIRHL
ncbi:hypothetical protein NDU88_003132 [Pleurodeles waltl]|uniref:Uncharacterized protein n=1 Tax=Pleurodeles waltl TaxID=8319 RepID=A0AAV7UZA3_PLEWA|nr:hypothetical protein NDU88_003132 [Pleurodeles waltl]